MVSTQNGDHLSEDSPLSGLQSVEHLEQVLKALSIAFQQSLFFRFRKNLNFLRFLFIEHVSNSFLSSFKHLDFINFSNLLIIGATQRVSLSL